MEKTTWIQNYEESLERTKENEKRPNEDSSYPKGVDILQRETTKKVYPDPEEIGRSMIGPQYNDVRHSGRVLELQNRALWTRPPDMPWHFPILVTVREMPFKNYSGKSSEKKGQRRQDRGSQEAEDLEKRDEDWSSPNWNQSWVWNTSFSPHLLPGEIGAQTERVSVPIGTHQPTGTAQKRRASVPIGSQPVEKAEIKRVRLRNGSHTVHGNEVIFTDPHKGIHGDEINFCS